MAILPTQNTTKSLIENQVVEQNKPRPYLSMSSVGEFCLRKSWYGFHWVKFGTITAKTKRIFDRGDQEEKVIVQDLKNIGVTCFKVINGKIEELTGEIGEQQEEMVGFGGHAKGHNDGRGIGFIEAPKTEHNLEFKTMQEKYFKILVKQGIRDAQPKYYDQAQKYMHEMGLTRTFFIVTNKNNQERYYERVRYNKERALELVKKEQEIIMSDIPPAKAYNENNFNCGFCTYKNVCHSGDDVNKNCRTCDNSDMLNDGIWHCSYYKKDISYDEQLAGCANWQIGWGL